MNHENGNGDEAPPEPFDGVFTDLGIAEIVPPKWIIKDLIPVGLVFIGAPPKAGKSTLTMTVALLTAGLKCEALPPYISEVDAPGTVMFFSFEATAGELKYMAEKGLGCTVPANESILVCDDPWQFQFDNEIKLNRLLHWARELKPRIIIIDPLRDFHQLEEKDSGEMNRLLRPLRQWAVENNSAVVIVHHTKKKEDENGNYNSLDLRGSSAFFGIADGVLMLTPRQEGTSNIRATFKRAKGWDRTFLIASYERLGQKPSEKLTEIDTLVLKSYENGSRTPEELARDVHIKPDVALGSLNKLKRNGLIP